MRDLGRSQATRPVSITVTLNYQHEAELAQLVQNQSDRRSPMFRHFLTNQQFNDYFAPSVADYARVAQALTRAGFRVTGTSTNRTTIQAAASAGVAEKYFSTEIHDVAQTNRGVRYANARPAVIPAELRGVVGSVNGLNNLIVAKPLIENALGAAANPFGAIPSGPARRQVKSHPRPRTPGQLFRTNATNVVADPGFESGGYTYWGQCGNISASITTTKFHTGTRSEKAGSTAGEPNGDAGLCQAVTIPANGKLTFWVYQQSNELNTTYAYQEAELFDANGFTVTMFYQTVNNTNGWVQASYDVSAYAGRTLYLYFGVHGDGYTGAYTIQYVDDVSLTSGTTPTPTPKPTATPVPTPTPTGNPTPTPVPTPTPAGCGTTASIGGALRGPDNGYGPVVPANSYDLPVQHGCNGTGRSSGVAISGDFQESDLSHYLAQFGITRTGPATTRVAVDGGATYSSTSADSEEATLDVETIVGLAPGTHLYMYLFPDLSSQHIEDGYNRAVADGIVDVLNSSFGGCETGDTAFATATNQIAQQGAAKGITFAASSGDSGSSECSGTKGVSAPASGPYFVAVGGTNLVATSTGAYSSETAWSGGGGGVSTVFAQPSYQVGITGASTTGRNLPDIAFVGDPNSGDSLYFAGAWAGPIGGTSWSSPIFSALITEIDQRQGAKAGFVNTRLYTAFKNNAATDFHDVISGSNGAYSAKAGFDNTTGVGSAKGFALSGNL